MARSKSKKSPPAPPPPTLGYPPSSAAALRLAPEAWDLGLHAQSEVGPVEVGLAIDGPLAAGQALGVVVQAPQVGRLEASFAIDPDGTTRLIALERVGEDGTPLPATVVAIDEGKTLRLEAALARAQLQTERVLRERAEGFAELTTARDEARDRAAALKDEAAAAAAQAQEREQEFHATRMELQQERERWVKGLGERELLKVQLEELQAARAEAGTDELNLVRARSEELEAKWSDAQRRLADAESTLRAERELLQSKLQAAGTELEGALANASERAALQVRLGELEAQLQAAQSVAAELAARTQEKEALAQELAARTQEKEALAQQLEAQAQERTTLQAQLEAAAAERAALDVKLSSGEAALTAELSALKAQLETVVASEQALRAELESLRAQASSTSEAQAKVLALEKERGTLRAEVRHAREGLAKLEARVSIARGESDAHKGEADRLSEELDKAVAAQRAMEAELQRLRELPGQLEAAQAAAATLGQVQAQLDSERAQGMSMAARVEQTESRLKELEPQLAAATAAAAQQEAARAALAAKAAELEAHAQGAQGQVARLRAERDEARGVARALHARVEAETRGQAELTATLAAERQLASDMLTEKQRLSLQIDSLSRQLDTERAARARLASELATGSGRRPAAADTSRQETKPYELAGLSPTVREMPALKVEPRTDPITLVPVPPGKGKK